MGGGGFCAWEGETGRPCACLLAKLVILFEKASQGGQSQRANTLQFILIQCYSLFLQDEHIMAEEGRMVTPCLSSVLYLTGSVQDRIRQGGSMH